MQAEEKNRRKNEMRCVDKNSLSRNYFYLPFDSKQIYILLLTYVHTYIFTREEPFVPEWNDFEICYWLGLAYKFHKKYNK